MSLPPKSSCCHLPAVVGADTTGAATIGGDAVGADTLGAATTGEATVGADMLNDSGESACAALDTRCRRSNAVWLKRRRYACVSLN